jgi:hypothetical protein
VSTFRLGTSLPRIDIAVRAGQALEFSVPVLDSAGLVVPAAGIASARAQVREGLSGGTLLHEFSTESGGATVSTDGLVVLTATAEQTAAWSATWPAAGAWWDLEVTDVADQPHQITAPSQLTVRRRITQ